MKKKFLLLILSCTLLGSLAWALAAADKEDPLASLSYLTGEFWETVEEAVDKRLDKSDQKLLEEVEESGGEIEVELASAWTETRLKEEDVLEGTTGTGALLLAGAMEVHYDTGAVVDVTDGTVIPSGESLQAQHRYLVAEDTAAVFRVTSPTAVMTYQGPYDFRLSDTPDYNAMARAIRELHLFRGTEVATGEGFELENPATRIQALIMFIRVLGEEEEALAWEGEIPFKDVLDWAKPYVGYAYEMGYTNGISPTAFGADMGATAQQYTEFVLRAMGYSSTANTDLSDTLQRAWEAGVLTEGEMENLGTLPVFTRAEMVYISYYALFAELPDGDTLADSLKSKDVFTSKEWKTAKAMVDTDRF